MNEDKRLKIQKSAERWFDMNLYRETFEGSVPEPTFEAKTPVGNPPPDYIEFTEGSYVHEFTFSGSQYSTDFEPAPTTLWQKCPLCDGEGRVPNNDGTAIYDECTVCRGHKIISTLTGKPPK